MSSYPNPLGAAWRFISGPWDALAVNRKLLAALTRHEIRAIYRGTALGVLWAVAMPVVMLGLYTFVFGHVMKGSFGVGDPDAKGTFALGIFNGLIFYEFVAFTLTQSPRAISSKPNFVKKIVFPLEILVPSLLGVAAFQFLVSWIVFVLGSVLFGSADLYRPLLVPFFFLPLIPYALGAGWLLAVAGVFTKDVGNAVQPVVTMLLFASAVFYPLSFVPEPVRWIFYANPLAVCVEESRRFAVLGEPANLYLIGGHLFVGCLVACIGLAIFKRSRGWFADVI